MSLLDLIQRIRADKSAVGLFTDADKRVTHDLKVGCFVLLERQHEDLELFKVRAAEQHVDHVQRDLVCQRSQTNPKASLVSQIWH
jgi:hypothetical protein